MLPNLVCLGDNKTTPPYEWMAKESYPSLLYSTVTVTRAVYVLCRRAAELRVWVLPGNINYQQLQWMAWLLVAPNLQNACHLTPGRRCARFSGFRLPRPYLRTKTWQ